MFHCIILFSDKSLGAARRIGALNAKIQLGGFVDWDVEFTDQWNKILEFAFRSKFYNKDILKLIEILKENDKLQIINS